MIGAGSGPRRAGDLDALLAPPPALPHWPGRVRPYDVSAIDREVEVAQGVFFPAWATTAPCPGR